MPLEKYHRLTVICKTNKKDKGNRWIYELLCDCGKTIYLDLHKLKTGNTKSCGCLKREVSRIAIEKVRHLAPQAASVANKKHGMRNTRFYRLWQGMKQRCKPNVENYGARGITFTPRWDDFQNFKDDMYESYLTHIKKYGETRTGTSLERINIQGNYEPTNCKWATHYEQCRNKTKNVFLEYNGQRKNKDTGKWEIVKKTTGEIVGHSDSKAKADASVRARYAGENKK